MFIEITDARRDDIMCLVNINSIVSVVPQKVAVTPYYANCLVYFGNGHECITTKMYYDDVKAAILEATK